MRKHAEPVCGYRLAGLDLDGLHHSALLNDQVQLGTAMISPKPERGWQSAIYLSFAYVANDEILEERAPQGIVSHLGSRNQTQQAGGKRRVAEIKLRRLREPLAEIAMVWAQEKDDVAGL